MSLVRHFRELDVYQNAMNLTMKIFELTKHWRKRRYQAAFVAKLSDSETEAAETQVSAEIALRCHYWDEKTFREIDESYETVLGQIVRMAGQPEKWLIRPRGADHG